MFNCKLLAAATTVAVCLGMSIGGANAESIADDSSSRSASCGSAQSSLRDQLGAEAKGPRLRFGLAVTEEAADRIDRLEVVRSSTEAERVRSKASEIYGERLVSVTWSYARGFEIRVTPAETPSPIHRLMNAVGLDGRSVVELPIVGGMSEVQREGLLNDLNALIDSGQLPAIGVVEIGTDEQCGVIRIGVAPAEEIDAVRAELAALVDLPSSGVDFVPVDKTLQPIDAVGRNDHVSTQSGGMRVTSGGACTSNLPWYRTNPGGTTTRFLVTAGHCIAQAEWSSTPNTWNSAWWTRVTSTRALQQGGTTVSSGGATIRYGAELDVAIWPTTNGTASRTAHNLSTVNFLYQTMGWWQWSPTLTTSTGGGDAVGDVVCQSGQTTSFGTGAFGVIERCGSLFERAHAYSTGTPNASWFYNMRQATVDVCGGDSGGTVWRGGGTNAWLSGVVNGRSGPTRPNLNGQPCSGVMTYSHVGYIASAFGLTAPTGMS